jgi:hypothetical protein
MEQLFILCFALELMNSPGEVSFQISAAVLRWPGILTTDLIIIDEVSILTPWVASRVSLTLQSISEYERIQFGGKRILLVGDLLQLSPIVPDFSMPVTYRLRTRFPYWRSILKFQIQQPMRAPDPSWATFLLSEVEGKTNEIQDWREL